MLAFLALYICLILGLVWAEFKEERAAQRVLKPLAALGFIAIALMSGALDTQYGKIILFGLMACGAGDVFLLSRNSEKLFLAGMASFAIGHLAYLSAFVPLQNGGMTAGRLAIIAIVMFGGSAIFTWLKPHLPKDMRIAVPIYVFIILLMVINALALPLRGPLRLAMIGGVMFAVSDIFVARDRFVTPTPLNALAITPLYFGAQALIALSTAVDF